MSCIPVYSVRWNESIPIELNGDTMYVAPPPASGVLLAFIMNILKGYHFQPDDVHSIEETILTVHRIVEAFKFAYGKRTEIGDPLFVDIAEVGNRALRQQ